MKIRIRLFFLSLFIAWFHVGFAQVKNLQFSRLSVEDGLSQSAVMAIFQDSRGYMWLGTQDGLNKYNSVDFITYRHNPSDSLSLPGNAISEIYEDRKGNLWAGTSVGLALYLPHLNAFKTMPVDVAHNVLTGMEVTSFLHDAEGNFWIGTTVGLFKWIKGDPSNVQQVVDGLPGNNIQELYQDKQGVIWVGLVEGLCSMRQNPDGSLQVECYRNQPGNPNSLSHNFVTVIAESPGGELWIGTRGGLNKMDRKSGRIVSYTSMDHGLINDFIRDILFDEQGNLWIGTYRGLCYFDLTNQKFVTYTHDPDNPYSLSDNSVHALCRDRKGTIWIGTYFAGVNLMDDDNNRFNYLSYYPYKNSVSYNIISAMVEDKGGNLWIGTEGKGLNYYKRRDDEFKHYVSDPDDPSTLSANNIKSLCLDHRGTLWIGTYRGGLTCRKPGDNRFTRHFSYPSDIFSIVEDTDHVLWIGSFGDGLWTYDSLKKEFVRFDKPGDPDLSLTDNFVRVVYEDSRNNLWIGTQNGLNVRFAGENKFVKYRSSREDPHSLGNNIVYAIREDSKGRLWIGSYGGGLNLYDYKTNRFRKYTTSDGLPGDNIFGILEDDEGNLWLSTNNGLSKFNPSTDRVINFNVQDGLPGNEFNFNSYLKTSSGEMFFGSKKGLTYFKPENIRESQYKAPIVFTGLKLFNKPVKINDRDGLLQQDFSMTPSVTFNYKQNVFTVEFALLNFLHPQKNRYEYKLEGLEDEWNHVVNPSATYTNLDQGTYRLLVRAANNDGIWTEAPASLHIEILPPPWKTWWAYSLYIVALAGLLLFFANFIRVRAKLEHDLHLEQLAKERDKELHQLKLQFFTNISHEIRTPLTLIIGPLQNIIEKYASDNFLNRQLVNVKANADRMLRLVNQLMDLRKQETGKVKLQAAEGNIVKFVREIKLSFQEKAISRNIDYSLITESDRILVWYDRDELEKVLFNLLSNAFKFTPEGGKIHINLSTVQKGGKGFFKLSVEDNGKGIPAVHLEKIFDRFYQIDKSAPDGSGVGLALAKGIVDLHHGEISAASREKTVSEPGKTVFTVLLPLGCDQLQEHEMVRNFVDSEQLIGYIEHSKPELDAPCAQPDNGMEFQLPKKPSRTLLIVEDNQEIRTFITDILSEKYRVYEASNGLEGWEVALRKLPDLIISDVVMPEMDGIELCRRLKTDERTSHIPVVLLTARTALIHKVNGYETGADEYVTKPFDIKLLEVRIRNLIDSRIQMRKKYGSKALVEPACVAATSTDEKFINKAIAIVEANILDEEFNVSSLAKEIGMSQPVLFRKIKALTNMNIADFIKSVRLKKAAQLLSKKEMSIAEVATEVGYNDPKYFSKIFKKYFGKLPSSYME